MNSNAYQNETSCKRYHLYIAAYYLVSNSPGIQESRVAEIEAVFRFFCVFAFCKVARCGGEGLHKESSNLSV